MKQVSSVEKQDTGREAIDERDFIRIAAVSTALGFGCVGAAVASLRTNGTGYYLQATAWTWVSFVAGAALGWFGWKLAARGKAAARVIFVVLTLIGIAAFLSPLRFISRDHLAEILTGLTVAVLVISSGAYLIWRVARALGDEARRTDGD